MLKIFSFLLTGCWHDYRFTGVDPVNHYDYSFGRPDFLYTAFSCQCTKCGNVKVIKDRSGTMTKESFKT